MAIISNATTIADAGAFSVGLGDMVLIKTITITSNTATVSFVHGSNSVVFDSTYPVYLLRVVNIHNDTDDKTFRYNFTADGSNFNVTKTTTTFRSSNYESGDNDGHEVVYRANADLAQSGNPQIWAEPGGNENDESGSGELWIFNPSGSTFVKHFFTQFNHSAYQGKNENYYTAGYCNTTSAITGIRYEMEGSTNIQSGTFKLYGLKDS